MGTFAKYCLCAVISVFVVGATSSVVAYAQASEQTTIEVSEPQTTDAQSVMTESPATALGVTQNEETPTTQSMQGSVPSDEAFKQQIINERSSVQPELDADGKAITSSMLVYIVAALAVCTALSVGMYIYQQRRKQSGV